MTAMENVVVKASAFVSAYEATRDVKTHKADNQVATKLSILLAAINQLQEEQLKKHDNGLAF